jgi:hypothetical protein
MKRKEEEKREMEENEDGATGWGSTKYRCLRDQDVSAD